ncbi:maltokinase N-terminal cap-like domain-containing protein [Nesterenkonia sp. CF4.4]|uniref:maltokinase N-terminal cap-like domain-containing protein n=1 Tax=Nesterenkonia sp. CF4.4 TaxID=3373079 RepID=UPI003EE4833B
MVSFRGEEQAGFLDLVGTWLSQQSWFQAAPGRRVISRVGGLRLPAPEGDPDQRVRLELHIFHVDHAGGQARVAVPMALRSRPSALAGKTAFIGRLRAAEGDLWVYDGAHDRAFLAAWHEMARRQQGSRNGRSRGEAFADFATWPAFTSKLHRTPLTPPMPAATRTAVTVDGGDGETRKTVVDFFREPVPQRSAAIDTVLRLAQTGRGTVSRVLGVITGSWPETNPTTGERNWVSGDLGIIRDSSLGGASASTLARTALHQGSDFLVEAGQLGRTLGDFHADLAGTFGAYPQTSPQLETMIDESAAALDDQWTQVRENLGESVPSDLPDTVDHLNSQLRKTDQAMGLQTIHGALNLQRILTHERDGGWIVDEDGGMSDSALPMRDMVSLLISLAEVVMEASRNGALPQCAEGDASVFDPGLWYEHVSAAVLEGYRHSDAEQAGLDTAVFRSAMLTEALALLQRSEGHWVFRPSLLQRT